VSHKINKAQKNEFHQLSSRAATQGYRHSATGGIQKAENDGLYVSHLSLCMICIVTEFRE